ncbi:NAD(P)/FAD-dependent oxidoreductase [Halomonas binhaiensis]|uniref:FAD-dependent oxidoreductase n=1 Tax=Halomonas binhaiensis TaxID=2562282 RepID=A0A5C1ND92_9GAMM|nr:FAD-dependent oxidoreductase [Halomonas binhaiensis]QEM81652.1 FAD-dependent oxidoreductase [Halomonas binhaiensis]
MIVPHIVLVGAGHAHLHLLDQAEKLRSARLTLVEPGAFWYSGLASSMLAGEVPPQDDRLDPVSLCRQRGVTLLRQRMVALDDPAQTITLGNGNNLRYDLLSLNLGSASASLPQSGEGPEQWPVKPVPQLLRLKRRITRQLNQGQSLSVEVVGAGASGVEIACALRTLGKRLGVNERRLFIRLIHHATETSMGLMPEIPRNAQNWLTERLARRDIEITGIRSSDQHVDHRILATGLRPTATTLDIGLPVINRGLRIHADLTVIDHPRIFATGDCAAMEGHVLPRLGVYGVRQGPILLHNLLAKLQGSPPRHYQPQPRALSILNLGDGEGLALYGRWWWGGRLASLFKSHLDRRFLDHLRRSPPD